MREILFRGQWTVNHVWKYGYLISDFGDNENFSIKNETGTYMISHKTRGQYTGMNDKNGKKVFEGDILKISLVLNSLGDYYFPPLDYPVNVVVKWDMCAWTWETATGEKYYIHFPEAWCHYEYEIIGNRWDNPELLEVQK